MRAPSPAVLLATVLVPAAALARPITVEGTVIDVHSRWTSDGSRIVTEATVRAADGTDMVVSQLGGTVDGLTMRTFPGPELLAPGMRVAAEATERLDLSQQMHLALDSVRVLAAPAGFVRTGPTKAGHSLFWESGCVFVKVSAEGTREIPGDQEREVVAASIASWNDGIAGCSYMKITEDKPERMEVGRDNVNLIKFRDASWCRPATGDDPPRCHADAAAGLTTAVYVDDPSSDRDGAIVDADIELNGVNFAIGVNGASLGTAPCLSELQNTLTHELGHLLGLEHPCRTPADPARVDETGAAVPTCSMAAGNPKITEATMYNYQDCGETKKESLSDDDIAAVCAIYPKANDPGTCDRVGDAGGCCSASGGGLPLGPVLGAIGFGALVLRRRPRQR
ncbi:MAG TPA: MYXO-CTERM sorting domain-containing protein [Kofleriaceae bacterium]|nr:MYXO-CTERM sorting domain-containing protein [Kofleriaceae bacterium]